MSEAAVKPMTLAEFLRWEDGTDTRYELLGGTAVAMPLPPVAHGVLAAHLCGAVGSRLRSRRTYAAQIGGAIVVPTEPILATSPISS